MNIPSISQNVPSVNVESYGQYSTNNYGLNTMVVSMGSFRLYYSYTTIVAFYDTEHGLVVSKNYWSTTTSKHLNWIDNGNKKNRVDSETFKRLLAEALVNHIK